ncbi:MAG: hypothetical protein KJ731_08625 [Alphaproteobacteria bacterium]|nr:hypothetical protein [Alphaproteobacteria bacterium]MBU1279344.1 hypothetical protein [Alphaproteobacteria bacterium]MBU1574161.1 hypothetical protein [Alphaproteobacteria bacterium]MBU1828527.1 hypothetical protein [Alphaproteobacteria bacterium]MBU2078399.1 hypothetical protein [Alphaproteobacteria bacterium]
MLRMKMLWRNEDLKTTEKIRNAFEFNDKLRKVLGYIDRQHEENPQRRQFLFNELSKVSGMTHAELQEAFWGAGHHGVTFQDPEA